MQEERRTFHSYPDILALNYYDLLDYLESYNCDVPTNIENPQDMQYAGYLMGTACNFYIHLSTLLDYARRDVRIAKDTQNRYLHEEAIDKRDAIEGAVRRMEKIMNVSSRLVTIRMAELKELNISEGK